LGADLWGHKQPRSAHSMGLRETKELEVRGVAGVHFTEYDALGKARTRTQDCTRLVVGVVRDNHEVTGRMQRAMTQRDTPGAFCGKRRVDGLRDTTSACVFANGGDQACPYMLRYVCEDGEPDACMAGGELRELEDEGPEALKAARTVGQVGRDGGFLFGNLHDRDDHQQKEDGGNGKSCDDAESHVVGHGGLQGGCLLAQGCACARVPRAQEGGGLEETSGTRARRANVDGGKRGEGGYRSTPKTMGVVSPRGGWRMGIRAGQRLWCVAGDRAWNRRGREMREVGDARVGDRRSGCGRTGCLTKCQGVRSKSAYGDRSVRSERDQSKLLVVKKPCASASARTA